MLRDDGDVGSGVYFKWQDRIKFLNVKVSEDSYSISDRFKYIQVAFV